MMTSDYILDVNEADFEYEVLAYSENTPVVIDFWATWCQPCKTLGPMLEQLAIQAGGAFRLARVDVDKNPNLALMYGVRSIPTVKAISQRNVVGEFAGLQPEQRLREFFAKITPPSPLELAIDKADSLLSMHQYSTSENMFREVLENNPDHPGGLLGLSKALLAQGQPHEANLILQQFPASRQYAQAQILTPLANVLLQFKQDILPIENDRDIAFQNCIRLISRSNLPAALDGLLDLLRQDKHYRNDKARQIFLALLEIMGEGDPLTRQYRSELATVLF